MFLLLLLHRDKFEKTTCIERFCVCATTPCGSMIRQNDSIKGAQR